MNHVPPLALQIAIHHYVYASGQQFPGMDFPMVKVWHDRLTEAGLLRTTVRGAVPGELYEGTEKLKPYIEALCRVPYDGSATHVFLAPDYELMRESQRKLMEIALERDDWVACLAQHVRQAEGERKQLSEQLTACRSKLRDRPLSEIPYDHLKAELARRDAHIAAHGWGAGPVPNGLAIRPRGKSIATRMWLNEFDKVPPGQFWRMNEMDRVATPDASVKDRQWTRHEEIDLVARYRAGLELEHIVKMHGREWQAIVTRLFRLSVHRDFESPLPWTEEKLATWRDAFFNNSEPRARYNVGRFSYTPAYMGNAS